MRSRKCHNTFYKYVGVVRCNWWRYMRGFCRRRWSGSLDWTWRWRHWWPCWWWRIRRALGRWGWSNSEKFKVGKWRASFVPNWYFIKLLRRSRILVALPIKRPTVLIVMEPPVSCQCNLKAYIDRLSVYGPLAPGMTFHCIFPDNFLLCFDNT